MFERHREKKAAEEYQQQLSHWQGQREGYAKLLDLAKNYVGEPSSEIMLKSGEAMYGKIARVALVEDRRGPGHWQGRSSGFSIPVGSTGIRYRVGATRGNYVQGAPVSTAIDVGPVYITNKRVIFQGAKQTRECMFDKLVGFQHDDKDGTTVFSVSNRQKPTTIHYGSDLSDWFDFRLDLAMAHYRNDVGALVSQLEEDSAALDASKPRPPTPQRAVGANQAVR